MPATTVQKKRAKVAMLLSNPFRPDPRVFKEARDLVEAGYEVSVIGWDRLGELPAIEEIEGFQVIRLRVASRYGAGSRQLFYLPRFWRQALVILADLKPDIIHTHDLDTAPVGFRYARKNRIPWIFDAHESYPDMVHEQVGRFIFYGLLGLERFIVPRASTMITVGDLLADRFRRLGADEVTVVGNYQSPDWCQVDLAAARTKLGLAASEFIVTYIGGLTHERAILPLVEASALVPDVHVLIAGDGPQRATLKEMLVAHPNVTYLGWVQPAELPDLVSASDVIYYGLRNQRGNSQYSAPNALFNALVAGKPVITTDVGEIALIVRKEDCGIVVPSPDPELVANALAYLKDSNVRRKLGERARKAAELRYNWGMSRKALLDVYESLV